MNKKFISVLFLAIISAGFVFTELSARESNRCFKEGYKGTVELGIGSEMTGVTELSYSLLTSHGYVLGKGFYIGMGTGVMGDITSAKNYHIPLYLDLKYSPVNKVVSPFIGAGIGSNFVIGPPDGIGMGLFLSPVVGMDCGRFSLFFRYTFRKYSIGQPFDTDLSAYKHFDDHLLAFNVAFSF